VIVASERGGSPASDDQYQTGDAPMVMSVARLTEMRSTAAK
jgi:hypothetical protein